MGHASTWLSSLEASFSTVELLVVVSLAAGALRAIVAMRFKVQGNGGWADTAALCRIRQQQRGNEL
jgi:hypothetical protein